MTRLLLKWFVHNHDADTPGVRNAVGLLSSGVGIAANSLLFVIKLLAGLLTGSLSITADALNNLSDASGSILTLIGFRLAGKPADPHHPYGHARMEYVSGLAVAAMILLIGFELGRSSVRKILHPEAVAFSDTALLILLVSIGIKFWLYLFNRKLGNHIHSSTLLATAIDSRNDCISTSAVLGAALLEQFWNLRVDGFIGLGVSVFILVSGWKLAAETISPLLGEGADPKLCRQIAEFIQANPHVLGYHDLMVHDYGPGRQYASLHVEMDYREDPLTCHEVIDFLEYTCLHRFGIHLVIHYDPVVTDDPELSRLKECCRMLLKNWDSRMDLHDFRMVPGRAHMNLIFDATLPADLMGQEGSIQREIENFLNRETNRAYHVKITFDLT